MHYCGIYVFSLRNSLLKKCSVQGVKDEKYILAINNYEYFQTVLYKIEESVRGYIVRKTVIELSRAD